MSKVDTSAYKGEEDGGVVGWARDNGGGIPQLKSRHEMCWPLWLICTEKCLVNIIKPSTSKPLILANPGPSQALPRKDVC